MTLLFVLSLLPLVHKTGTGIRLGVVAEEPWYRLFYADSWNLRRLSTTQKFNCTHKNDLLTKVSRSFAVGFPVAYYLVIDHQHKDLNLNTIQSRPCRASICREHQESTSPYVLVLYWESILATVLRIEKHVVSEYDVLFLPCSIFARQSQKFWERNILIHSSSDNPWAYSFQKSWFSKICNAPSITTGQAEEWYYELDIFYFCVLAAIHIINALHL